MKVVKLQKQDLGQALDLVWNVFQEYVAPDYSEEGMAFFKKFIDYASIIQRVDTGEMQIWGSFINHNLVGIIATLKANHISMLFTKKEYQRQGIAKKLFLRVVDSIKIRDKKIIITVNSSPYAVEVYRHLGFKDTSSEQTVNGIRFTPMEYRASEK